MCEFAYKTIWYNTVLIFLLKFEKENSKKTYFILTKNKKYLSEKKFSQLDHSLNHLNLVHRLGKG